MPTINQLVRKGRQMLEEKINGSGSEGVPAETRRVHSRLHDDAQETEFGTSQGCACPLDQRH